MKRTFKTIFIYPRGKTRQYYRRIVAYPRNHYFLRHVHVIHPDDWRVSRFGN